MSRSRSRSPSWPAVLLLVLTVTLGCSDAQPELYQCQFKWIAAHSDDLYSVAAISQDESVRLWSFKNGLLPSCSVVGSEVLGPSPRGLRLRTTEPRAGVRCHVDDLDSDQVSLIEIVIEDLRSEPVELSWDRSDSESSGSDRITLDQWSRSGEEGSVFPFEMWRQPSWGGEIATIDVMISSRVGKIFTLGSIEALRRVPDRLRLLDTLDREWRVELGHEWQNAILTTDSVPHRRKIEIPASSQLRFSFGLTADSDTPVQFRIRFLDTDNPVASDVIFEETIEPEEWSRNQSWRSAKVELEAISGRTGIFELSSPLAGTESNPFSLAAWGNPEVWSRQKGPVHPNIVFVLIDTLRADHLSAYGYARPTSPNIDHWAAGGALFTTAVTQSPWTLPAHVSMFSGLEAFRHGMNFPTQARIPRLYPFLAEILSRSGYVTRAITGGGFVHPRYGFARGFDSYSYWPSSRPRSNELSVGVERSISWLDEHREFAPLFLFLHTFDVHAPYRPRAPYFERFHGEGTELRVQTQIVHPSREDGFVGKHQAVVIEGSQQLGDSDGIEALAVDLYDSGIAHADQKLGRLFDYLSSSGMADQTLVVLMSDHGEALGDRGVWAHGHLDDSNLLIPLIMTLPRKIAPGTRIDQQVRLIDAVPTILELVGLPGMENVDGLSLVPLLLDPESEAEPKAWTYAASTNEGLALRWRNRLKYVFRDSVWPPLSGEDWIEELNQNETIGGARSSNRANLGANLRQSASSTLSSALVGLRIELANGAGEALEGGLHSDIIEPVTVKSADLERPRVAWERLGHLTFSLQPNDRHTLIFSKQPISRLELRGEVTLRTCANPVQFEIDVPIERLRKPLRLELDSTSCRFEDLQTGTATTGLSLWWSGEMPEANQAGAESASELRRQLEALGYVDN